MTVYFDNSATTKPCEESIDAVTKMLKSDWGNPSSLHAPGVDAMTHVIKARETIARSLGVSKDEIYFTSGGTEANNLAIFGAVKAKKRLGNRIVTTAIEHESVLQCAQELEKMNFEVVYLKPDSKGNISEEQIFNAVNGDTILVSVMYINNEVGSIMPVQRIRRAVTKAAAPALVHIDCVQAYGKIPLRPKKLGADVITVSAHKVHGPKGIGALYIDKSSNLKAQNFATVFGGEQEKRIRPGTLCSPLIAGFGAAVEAFQPEGEQNERIAELNRYTRKKLAEIDGVIFNNDENASPYIINIYVPSYMRSQTIIQELSSRYGICVSNGSACAGGKKSHVLTAMGLDNEIIDKSIRISFCRDNTIEEADRFISALKELIKKH